MKNGIGVHVDVKSIMGGEKSPSAKTFGPQVDVKKLIPEKQMVTEKNDGQPVGRKNAMIWAN